MKNKSPLLKNLLKIGKLINYKKKETLLSEGGYCNSIFIIERGCVRSWFNDDGNDVTFQLFFEDDIVTSFESLKNNIPSLYNIETLTSVQLRVITKSELLKLLNQDSNLKAEVNDFIINRLYHYQKLFISRIKNNPQRRFEELFQNQPEIFDKVPHHYIASYLGITSVSLSRIRAKKKCDDNNC